MEIELEGNIERMWVNVASIQGSGEINLLAESIIPNAKNFVLNKIRPNLKEMGFKGKLKIGEETYKIE